MNTRASRLGLTMAVLLLLTACSAVRQREVLVLFFDGVPEREKAALRPVPAVLATATEAAPALPALYLAARAAPPGFRHKPYAERDCLTCHESQFSQKMRGTVTEVCQQCHQGVFSARLFAHTPVANGECLECHRPHESLQPALLSLPGNGVWFECHAQKPVMASRAHSAIGGDSCHTCHDPHGGQSRFFLKAGAATNTAGRSATGTAP